MAKMFYTLQEAAQRLNVSEHEVRSMSKSGRIQEFRDRDKLMFKVEQVDLLAEDNEPLSLESTNIGDAAQREDDLVPGDTGGAPLLDLDGDQDEYDLDALGETDLLGSALPMTDTADGTGITPNPSTTAAPTPADQGGDGTSYGLDDTAASPAMEPTGLAADTGGMSGISIFDSGAGETGIAASDGTVAAEPSLSGSAADDTFATGVSGTGLEDSGADAGAGLMNITQESDDTSLGMDFLDDLGGDSMVAAAAQQTSPEPGMIADGDENHGNNNTGVDEYSPAVGAGATAAAAPYDGGYSGMVGGAALAACVGAMLGIAGLVTGAVDVSGSGSLTGMLADNIMAVAAGLAGLIVVSAAIGFVVGKRG